MTLDHLDDAALAEQLAGARSRVQAELSRLRQPVVILPGNHDSF